MTKLYFGFPYWSWTDILGPEYIVDEIELGFRVASWLVEERAEGADAVLYALT